MYTRVDLRGEKIACCISSMGCSLWLSGQESTCNAGDPGLIPGLGNPLEKGMATHSSILTWEISWTEEPSGLQSMGSQSAGHDLGLNNNSSFIQENKKSDLIHLRNGKWVTERVIL